MIYLAFFLTVSLFLYGLITISSEKKLRIESRVAVFVTGENKWNDSIPEKEEQLSVYQRFLKPYIRDYKQSFKKRMPGEKEAKIEKKLQQAGNPFGMTPVDFRLFQAACLILLPLLFGGYLTLLGSGAGFTIIFMFIALVMGLGIPHFYLKQKTKVRSHKALRELPDILDLMTVSLEAGLGFDSAISKVVSKKEGVLAGEFHRCLEEMRLGKVRREALSGIKNRLAVDEVRNFISSILQAEKLGIGMVQVLRAQSVEVREQRKQRAEEQAMKAPIKMLFPLVLFIFPSLFIVLLGPALIQFIDAFK